MKKLAPVVLFVYNRPKHTLRTLQALQKNPEASQTDLFIFCDGAKPNASNITLEKIDKVRKIIRTEKWCQNVIIFEEQTNKGLAQSIIEGVTKIITKYQKIIVLEDDIQTSPAFLKFMNQALDFYEKQEKVMHISGYMFPVKVQLPDTFFFNTASCWGWATWQRAWQYFNSDAQFLLNEIEAQNLSYQFAVEGTSDHLNQLKANVNGTLKTWAVKWYASIFLEQGLCLHPNISFTQNIGQDSTGVHSGSTNYYQIPMLATEVNLEKIPLEESQTARNAVRKFWENQPKATLSYRIKSKIKKIIRFFE